MHERGRRVLRQVADACFHERARLTFDCPGRALRLLVDHAFDVLHGFGRRVLKRAGDDALLADREL